MDIKSLSSCQVWLAQKLSCYYFRIDYWQSKANRAANALSCFFKRNKDEEKKLQAENTQILHCLQSLLTNATLSGLSVSSLFLLHHVFICGTYVLPQLRQFWNLFRTKLGNEKLYKASIGSIRLRLQALQEIDSKAQELRVKEGYQDINGVLHHQGLPFVPKAIWIKLISCHHNDPLAGHFKIDKIQDLFARKYFWPMLWYNIEAYIKSCDVYLVLKVVRHKPYDNL